MALSENKPWRNTIQWDVPCEKTLDIQDLWREDHPRSRLLNTRLHIPHDLTLNGKSFQTIAWHRTSQVCTPTKPLYQTSEQIKLMTRLDSMNYRVFRCNSLANHLPQTQILTFFYLRDSEHSKFRPCGALTKFFSSRFHFTTFLLHFGRLPIPSWLR